MGRIRENESRVRMVEWEWEWEDESVWEGIVEKRKIEILRGDFGIRSLQNNFFLGK